MCGASASPPTANSSSTMSIRAADGARARGAPVRGAGGQQPGDCGGVEQQCPYGRAACQPPFGEVGLPESGRRGRARGARTVADVALAKQSANYVKQNSSKELFTSRS